jgi:hypothetical protein
VARLSLPLVLLKMNSRRAADRARRRVAPARPDQGGFPGQRWIPALEDAIGRSSAVAILLDKHGIGSSQQYERELALIRQTQDPMFTVIPVLMPGCDFAADRLSAAPNGGLFRVRGRGPARAMEAGGRQSGGQVDA